MIYLIGGVARSGKTRLAKMLLQRRRIPFISTDTLVDMVRDAAPQLGLANWGRQKADDFAPFVRSLVYHLPYTVDSYVIEGNGFWPHHVESFGEQASVRTCFLGYAAATITTLSAEPSWLDHIQAERRHGIVDELLQESGEIEAECHQLGLTYFNVEPLSAPGLKTPYEFLTATS